MVRQIISINSEKKLSLITDGLREISSITEEIVIVLWIHHSISNSNSNISSNGINYHILPPPNGNICLFDISEAVNTLLTLSSTPDNNNNNNNNDSIWFILNLISLSSAILIEKSTDDNATLQQLHFLEQTLSLFHNEMGTLKSTITFPPLVLYSSSPIPTKESKKLIENFIKPESGFSEDISRRNTLRGLIDSIFHSREILSPEVQIQDPIQLMSSSNFTKRFSFFQSLPFGCLISNGLLITKILQSFIGDGVGYQRLSQDIRDQLIEEYLSYFEQISYDQFSSQIKSNNSSSSSNSPTSSISTLKTLKRNSIEFYSNHIAVWNQNSIESKKKLHSRIENDINNFRNIIRQQISEKCHQYLVELDKTTITTSSSASDLLSEFTTLSNITLTLGESTNSYNEFLALKGAIEKLVTSYSTTTQSYLNFAQDSTTSEGSVSGPLGANERIFPEEINYLRSEILRSYLIQRIKKSLDMGGNWLIAFSDLVQSTTNKKDTMKANQQSLQDRNVELDRSIDQKKRVTAENYRLLTTSLTELRSKQTLELETKHSEIESLVESIDRSTRLNEREKAEIADELMEIQQRIQVAQARALELRQQREEQTNLLHNNLLESEREGHRWFRSAFANQHTLLAEELALERQLNQRKSEQLAELFALEGEHLRHLDNIRTLGQKETQKLREEHFNKRDTLSKEHDATMTYLRMRNIELEGKLSTNSNSTSQKSEEGCQVM